MVWINANESHAGIAGDWHGNTPWALRALDAFASARIRTILHVGDFGLWPGEGGAAFLRAVDRALAENGQTIYVTPGSHEWYAKLDRTQPGSDGLRRVTPRIIFLPRGYRWGWGMHTFISLGGAPSVDFDARIPGLTWWAEEAITPGDIQRIRADVDLRGGADVMIAHDAPKGVRAIDEATAAAQHGFSPEGVRYAQEGRDLLDAAFRAVKPRLLFHGRYHQPVDEVIHGAGFSTRVVGLDRECSTRNLATLALDDLSVESLVPRPERELAFA